MNWTAISAAASIIFVLLGAWNTWITLQVKLELASLKLELAQARASDRDWVRAWVEGEFVRRAEIDARFETLRARLDRLDDRRRADKPDHSRAA